MVMDKTMDRVLCYGVLCVDQIVRTATYPPPDRHARILEEGHFIGGEAANSAAMLARLGVPVTLRGNFIGADERGRFSFVQNAVRCADQTAAACLSSRTPISSSATRNASSSAWLALRRGSQWVW